jgi:hypothetical protein
VALGFQQLCAGFGDFCCTAVAFSDVEKKKNKNIFFDSAVPLFLPLSSLETREWRRDERGVPPSNFYGFGLSW